VIDVYAIPRQLVFTFSAILATLGVAVVYNGYQWALSPLVAVAAFSWITGQIGEARSIKSQMKWLAIMPVRGVYHSVHVPSSSPQLGGIVTFVALKGGRIWSQHPSGSTMEAPRSSRVEISGPEVAFIISMVSAIIPLSVPGTLVSPSRYHTF
jgi:hypothetical protein